jgi:hypothetical protein
MMAIIECFENGKPNLFHQTYWNAETKELSGGLLMASTLSGNLGTMLRMYQKRGGTGFSDMVIRSVESETILNSEVLVKAFQASFKNAASDPLMKATQLDFFSTTFLAPAETMSASLGITEPLGRVVVFDSFIQGAFKTVKQHVMEHYPNTQQDLNQWDLIREYLKARRDWLANSSNKNLHKTVDRVDSLIHLEQIGNWKLDLPLELVTKGYVLDERDVE